MALAAARRDESFGLRITYSPKVFVTVDRTVPLLGAPTPESTPYLETKRSWLGHILPSG